MKANEWSEVFCYWQEVEQQKNSYLLRKHSQENMEMLRSSLISILGQMKENLQHNLNERYLDMMLFAFIAFLDEEMQRLMLTSHSQAIWTPIQQEFYNTSNAGELFYKALDDALDDTTLPSIVFEVYYFVLKRGFRGKYAKAPTRIGRYLDFLSKRITVAVPEGVRVAKAKAPEESLGMCLKPSYYYAATAVAVLGIYAGLYLQSNGLWGW